MINKYYQAREVYKYFALILLFTPAFWHIFK